MQLRSQPDLAMQEIRAQKGLGREQDEDLWRDRFLSDLLQVRKCRIRHMRFDRLTRNWLDEYDMAPADVTITCNVNVNQFGKFIEYQGFQIHSCYSLLESACAMSDDLNDLISKLVVRCDFGVPSLYKIFDNYRYESIELEINLVGSSQRGQ